jgi:hypothetical protein
MVKVLMSTLSGAKEIEVDSEGNNKDLQLHINLEKLGAIDKTLKIIEELWKGH